MTQALENALLSGTALPRFGAVTPADVAPAVDALIATHRREVEALKAQAGRGFDEVVLPLERVEDALSTAWSTVSHLKGVADTPELRVAHAEGEAKLVDYGLQLMQDRALYDLLGEVAARPDFAQAPEPRRAAVERWLREFRLSGVALEGQAAERFREIGMELSKLSTEFANAVVDATDAWSEPVEDEATLSGVPEADRAMLKAYAQAKGRDGWLVTLQAPSVTAILTYADDRELRRRVYAAFGTRASDQGPDAGAFDNGPRMRRILALRAEAAQLLGFRDHVERTLSTRMARSAEEVRGFLLDLARRARPAAEEELQTLRAFARDELGIDDLQPWDMGYAGEKLRKARYAVDASEVKAYLPLDAVLPGMFALVKDLFGVEARPRPDVETWHADASYYDLADATGHVFAGLYLDVYARPAKRSGAWMAQARSRFRDGNAWSDPVAYLTCNFAPPTPGRPSLLTHNDATTLLHEMGHVLHHLLTEVDVPSVGGISGVEWDAVELPSQLLENFAWSREVLTAMSRHVETGAPIPDDLFDRMTGARRFQAALGLLRQVEFALFDLELHSGDPGRDPLQVLEQVRDEVAVVRPPAWHRFPMAFTHVFAGGYGAGYYSYLWAELLAVDGFAQFAGGDLADTGARYRREVLSRGGVRPAAENFRAFVGRDPDPQALLRHYGLAA